MDTNYSAYRKAVRVLQPSVAEMKRRMAPARNAAEEAHTALERYVAEKGVDALPAIYNELCAKRATAADDAISVSMRARLIGHFRGRLIA